MRFWMAARYVPKYMREELSDLAPLSFAPKRRDVKLAMKQASKMLVSSTQAGYSRNKCVAPATPSPDVLGQNKIRSDGAASVLQRLGADPEVGYPPQGHEKLIRDQLLAHGRNSLQDAFIDSVGGDSCVQPHCPGEERSTSQSLLPLQARVHSTA